MIADVGLIRSGCAAFEGSQGLGSKPRVDGIRHSVKFSGVKRRARENADHAGEDILVSGAAMLGLYGRPEEASKGGPGSVRLVLGSWCCTKGPSLVRGSST